MLKHELTLDWHAQAPIAKELSSLTEMGTMTHLHTAAALKEMGIDIGEMALAHTCMVFDNNIKPDAITNQATLDKLKSRMAVDGSHGVVKKGVHHDDTFSATPKLETCRLMVVLKVLLQQNPIYKKNHL